MRAKAKVRWVAFAFVLYLALCVIGGIVVADGALHPGRRILSASDIAGFQRAVAIRNAPIEDVLITTPDGTVLRGWFVRPRQSNGEAALLLHGLADNRMGMTGYATLLLSHGFGVLLPDARAHGASGGALATYGLLERDDIRQWVDFLRMKAKPGCVYGLGESMGAADLLQSLESGASFCAVVAESSFSNFREIAYDRMGQPLHLGPWVGRTILRPMVDVAFLRARWKYGLNMERVSPEAAVAGSNIPVLLIHGQVDSNIPVRHSMRIHALAPRTKLWEVPGADHCGAMASAQKEYAGRLLSWFHSNSRP